MRRGILKWVAREGASPSSAGFSRARWGYRATGPVLIILTLFFASILYAAEFPFKDGETIHYDIKKMGMKAGEATLTFNGVQEKDGQEALLIIFASKGFQFFDEEKIYLDPKTFYPIVVERDLHIFGKNEKITENYSHNEVRIVKTTKDNKVEEVIKKGAALDNIYGFIYRYRARGSFEIGEGMEINLPTQEVTVKLADRRKYDIDGHSYDAFYAVGKPKKLKIWFADTSDKLPLRIDGALMGKTSLIMKEKKE